MKNIKLFGLMLSMIIAISAVLNLSMIAEASGETSYTYTVKFVIGDKQFKFDDNWRGAFSDGNVAAKASINEDKTEITVKDLEDKTTFNFDYVTATNISSDKYVVRGIRKSGEKDPTNPHITVTQDETYVVAYGVGTVVSYTVEYAGTPVSQEPTKYYGIEGQRNFYIPCKYIEGYKADKDSIFVSEPLVGGEKFVFTYTPVSAAGGTGRTIYNESTNTVYATEIGDPEYTYQTIPAGAAEEVGGVNDNRVAAEEGQGAAEAEAADETQIADEDVPLSGGADEIENPNEEIEIPDEEVAKVLDEDALMAKYIRYLIIVAIIGLLIALIAVFGSVKMNYDKHHKN